MTNLANRLPDSQPPLSAAAFNARRDINRDKYAASGYIEPGRQYKGGFAEDIIGPGGMWTSSAIRQAIRFGRNSRDAAGYSFSGNPVFHIDGLIINMVGLNWVNEENNQINLPPAPMGHQETTTLTTRAYRQGDHVVVGNDIYVCVHPNGAAEGSVLSDPQLFERDDVVSREDLVGLEVFCVELGDEEGMVDAVYPYGNVQYGPTTWNGFSLSTNAMPQSYSAQYEDDTQTTGRGLKWTSLTPEQRNRWAQQYENNIFVDNGNYFQWQYRARVLKSRGGHWHVGAAWEATSWALRDNRNNGAGNEFNRYPTLQGSSTITRPDHLRTEDDSNISFFLTTLNSGFPLGSSRGVAATGITNDSKRRSAGGVGYFYSLARVRRLNEGGYHPVYNMLGTKTWRRQDINGDNRWINGNTFQPENVAQCFQEGPEAMTEGYYINSGLLNSPRSGHPQDYRSDIIYGWQIQDLRMDAHGYNVSSEEYSSKLLHGDIAGWEQQVVMRLMDTTLEEIVDDVMFYVADNVLDEWGVVGAYTGGGYIYNKTKDDYRPISIYHHSSGRILIQPLKESVSPEHIDNFYSSSLLERSNRPLWDVGDVVTLIGYKRTYVASSKLECMDIIATAKGLVDTFERYGVDRVFGARWLPAELGVNGSAGVVCKARRRVINPFSVYVNKPEGYYANVDYPLEFATVKNEATITEGADHSLFLLYVTRAMSVSYYGFGHRLLDGQFGDVKISNMARDDLGGALCYAMTGKVPVSDDYIETVTYKVDSMGLDYSSVKKFDIVATAAGSAISHVDINFQLYSDGFKYSPFFSLKETHGLVYGQASFKEVLAGTTSKDYTVIDLTAGSVNVELKAGDRFVLKGTARSSLDDKYLIAISDHSATWTPGAFNGFRINYDDRRIYSSSGAVWPVVMLDPTTVSGDDGEITPRSSLLIVKDLNDNDVMLGTVITNKPLGFLPKEKRRNNRN